MSFHQEPNPHSLTFYKLGKAILYASRDYVIETLPLGGIATKTKDYLEQQKFELSVKTLDERVDDVASTVDATQASTRILEHAIEQLRSEFERQRKEYDNLKAHTKDIHSRYEETQKSLVDIASSIRDFEQFVDIAQRNYSGTSKELNTVAEQLYERLQQDIRDLTAADHNMERCVDLLKNATILFEQQTIEQPKNITYHSAKKQEELQHTAEKERLEQQIADLKAEVAKYKTDSETLDAMKKAAQTARKTQLPKVDTSLLEDTRFPLRSYELLIKFHSIGKTAKQQILQELTTHLSEKTSGTCIGPELVRSWHGHLAIHHKDDVTSASIGFDYFSFWNDTLRLSIKNIKLPSEQTIETAKTLSDLLLKYGALPPSNRCIITQKYENPETVNNRTKLAKERSKKQRKEILSQLRTGIAAVPLDPPIKPILVSTWNGREYIWLEKEKDIDFKLRFDAYLVMADELVLSVKYKPAQRDRAIEIVKTVAPILADYTPV